MEANQQRGISLLEILLVVLVAAVIVSAAVIYYAQTLRGSRVAQAVNFLQQVSKAGHEWLQIPNSVGQYPADFSGLSGLGDLVSLQLLPCENSSCYKNSWGGTNTLTVDGNSQYMRVTLSLLPVADCSLLQQQMQNIVTQGLSQQNYCQAASGATTYQVYL